MCHIENNVNSEKYSNPAFKIGKSLEGKFVLV